MVIGMLSGPIGLGSLVLAIIAVWLLRRVLFVRAKKALALSFAAQVAVMLLIPTLIGWLSSVDTGDTISFVAEDDSAERLRFSAFVVAPIAVAHLLLLPFIRKA
jgi:hypothetical protein